MTLVEERTGEDNRNCRAIRDPHAWGACTDDKGSHEKHGTGDGRRTQWRRSKGTDGAEVSADEIHFWHLSLVTDPQLSQKYKCVLRFFLQSFFARRGNINRATVDEGVR